MSGKRTYVKVISASPSEDGQWWGFEMGTKRNELVSPSAAKEWLQSEQDRMAVAGWVLLRCTRHEDNYFDVYYEELV